MPKNSDDLVIPARDGTMRVLKAATIAGVRLAVGITNLFLPGLSFILARAAAFFTWKYFYDKDKAELATLLNPPEENLAGISARRQGMHLRRAERH